MIRSSNLQLYLICLLLLSGCLDLDKPDAYGRFEAVEWTVSATGEGEIIEFNIEEGMIVKNNQAVGLIDTIELSIQREYLRSSIATLRSSLPDVALQVEVLKEKKRALEKEQQRTKRLVESGAADSKKLDPIDEELNIVERQISATTSSLHSETAAIVAQIESLEMQFEIVNHRIERCTIINPEEGVVQLKFAKQYEYASIGRPLYRIMNSERMTLHCWLSEKMLSTLQVGDSTNIAVMGDGGDRRVYRGEVSYISKKAEFSAGDKNGENRSLQLYHIKIIVTNDGSIRAGTTGELYL